MFQGIKINGHLEPFLLKVSDYTMVRFYLSLSPHHAMHGLSIPSLLLKTESTALNQIRLGNELEKPQNKFRKIILKTLFL